MRPAPRLISDSARWPKITAAIEDGTKQRITPQIRLATALLLVCGGAPHSGCAVAACGTGCDTPQYGHTGTKSARFPWQFVHCFKNVSPGAPWCASSTRPAPRMYMEIGRFVYHAIQPASGAAEHRGRTNLLKISAWHCQSHKGGREWRHYAEQRRGYRHSGRWQRHAAEIFPNESAASCRWAPAYRTRGALLCAVKT